MKKVIAIQAGHAPAKPFTGKNLADTRGRGMRDLRISVTDRCNFRCVYCMPREVFDAETWAFVHFLMFGENGKRVDYFEMQRSCRYGSGR